MVSNIAVYGLCKDAAGVKKAVDSLRLRGFRETDISVLFQDNQGSKDLAHEKHTKAPEGGMVGAGCGALAGGALGWMAGAGLVAIPGAGAFVAAGFAVAVLAGVGAGVIAGAIIGALIGMRMPEYVARRYEGRIRNGGILISAHCDNRAWANRAKDLLAQAGVERIGWAAEAGADFMVTSRPLPRIAERGTGGASNSPNHLFLTLDGEKETSGAFESLK